MLPKLKIEDMPYSIQNACLKRGFKAEDKLSIYEAMAEYTAWELGDSSWGTSMYNAIIDMQRKLVK